MAGKIFYGTSETAANEPTKSVNVINWATEKEVTIRQGSGDDENVTIIDQAEGELTIGDILVVLFTNGNTSPSVTLSLGNGTISNEVDVTNDAGIPVRSYAVDGASLAGAWTTGEAKIFVLAEGSNSNNYFEMLGSIKGDGSNFGNVQITNQVSDKGPAYNLTLSPSGVKSYVDGMTNLSLGWTGEQSGSPLGVLSLKRGTHTLGTGITINYPDISVPTINSTNQILNEGPKNDPSNPDNNKYGIGSPFLTKNVPNRICFYKSASGNPYYGTNTGIYYGDRGTSQIENQHLIMNVCSNDQYNVDIYNPHANRPTSATNFHGYITLNPAPNSWVRIGEAPGYGGNLWVKDNAIVNGNLTINKNLIVKGSLNYQGLINFNNKVSILGKASDGYGLYVEELAKFNKNVDFLGNISLRKSSQISIGAAPNVLINKDGITIGMDSPASEINLSNGGLKFGEGNIISKAYRFVFVDTGATAGGRSTGSSSIFANATGVIVTPVVPEADKDIFPGIKDVVLKGVTEQSGVMEIRFINKPGRSISRFAVDVLVIKGNEAQAI